MKFNSEAWSPTGAEGSFGSARTASTANSEAYSEEEDRLDAKYNARRSPRTRMKSIPTLTSSNRSFNVGQWATRA